MISAYSAVSDSRIAPRTDCSASRCAAARRRAAAAVGRWPLAGDRAHRAAEASERLAAAFRARANVAARRRRARRFVRSACAALLLLDDHRLDGRGDAVGDLDDDHVGADVLDRLVEVDLAAVDRDAAGLLDRVGDVLRR